MPPNEELGATPDVLRIEGLKLVSRTNLPPQENFLRQLADDYNLHTGRPRHAVVNRPLLIAWLNGRADANGPSVLENRVLLHRHDVREAVLEQGEVNLCHLQSWMITYGAHELGLDSEILAGTIVAALGLRQENRSPVAVADQPPTKDDSIVGAVERLTRMLREQRVA